MIKDFHVEEKKPVPLAVVKTMLKNRKDEGDLILEQKTAFEHAKKFSKLTDKQAEKMVEDLKELGIRRLKDEQVVAIVDFLPQNPEDLKLVTSNVPTALKAAEIEKILEVIKKFTQA